MDFRDAFIGSAIVGIFSYIISAVILLLILKGGSNFIIIVKDAFTTYQITPLAIGLATFLVFFSHYSLVDIPPSIWDFYEKWDETSE
jgi:hypothetical protein